MLLCFYHNATLSIPAVCNTALGLAHGTIPENDREYRERHTVTYASEGGWPSSIRASPAMRGAVNTRAYKWAGMGCSLGVCAWGLKVSAASKRNLRSMALFLHRLVAIDSYYTPSEFGFRKPKRWGPRRRNQYRRPFGSPKCPEIVLPPAGTPNVSVFEIQIRVACRNVNSHR